jgi:hypothetical protein
MRPPEWVSIFGMIPIAVALRDIFHTLFHPTGTGAVSDRVQRAVWRASRLVARRRRGAIALGGPLGYVAVIVTWGALLAGGWALIYWPQMPEGFQYASGLTPSEHAGFDDAVYLSLVTIVTLGFGDISPAEDWLRIVTPLEGFVGFALLTAAISWVLAIYPAIARRQTLAQSIALLGEERLALHPRESARILDRLASELVAVRIDLELHPAAYYFHHPHEETSLPRLLPQLAGLARPDEADEDVLRAARGRLHDAVSDYARALGQRFLNLSGRDVDDVLAAYARDHYED